MSMQLTDIATSISTEFAANVHCTLEHNELTVEVAANSLLALCSWLKQSPFAFAQLSDLAGLDYAQYSDGSLPARFAVVYHLLSLQNNLRIRIKTYCQESSAYCAACQDLIMAPVCAKCGALAPHVPSVVSIWTVANWYEREAFDLFGIVFTGHPQLTRILTEDDLCGHALRKDFPMVGKTEVYYDEDAEEVTSKPVSIEDRQVIQKIGSPPCMTKRH